MELVLDKVCVNYDRYRAIDSVSFDVQKGEILSLLGPNGSGKSTLIKSIARVQKPSGGSILLDGRDTSKMDVREVARLIGYVPQNFQQIFYTSVIDTVLLGRKPYIRWKISDEDLRIVDTAMETMGIRGLGRKMLHQISGGEKQKVFIARALAQNPKLFLFDEPTSNLDLKHQIDVLETARVLSGERKSSMVVALHDLNLAYNYSDRIVMLKKGKVFAMGTPEEVLTARNIREVYDVNVSILDSDYGKYIMPVKADRKAAVRAIAL